MKKVQLITDGACLGNPGPGGWACILIHNQRTKEMWGSEPHTTNNRMDNRSRQNENPRPNDRPHPQRGEVHRAQRPLQTVIAFGLRLQCGHAFSSKQVHAWPFERVRRRAALASLLRIFHVSLNCLRTQARFPHVLSLCPLSLSSLLVGCPHHGQI